MAAAQLTAPDAVVIGAGCAGLSAAARLAARGRRVLVLEARSRLGGRATAFPDRQTGERIDNGQHILVGCYRDTLAFLEQIGARNDVEVAAALDVTMVDCRGERTRLQCGRGSLTMSLAIGMLRWDALTWRDRLAALRVAADIRAAARGDAAVGPRETVSDWLTRRRQTPALRKLLWEPLALAALNEAPEVGAAAPFLRVLGDMFGGRDRQAAALVIPKKPLDELYAAPARAFIEAHGGTVRTGASARVRFDASGPTAIVEAEEWAGLPVVVAVPWFTWPSFFVGETALLGEWIDAAARTAASPIVTVNLWFDRAVVDVPLVGLPGRDMQWVFDKRRAFGDTASHLSLVSSGAGALATRTNEEIIDTAMRELSEALPAVKQAVLRHASVVRDPHATFSVAPGVPRRPPTVSPVRGLFLAGDWIDTGLPATIESAVRSGHWAADAILASHP